MSIFEDLPTDSQVTIPISTKKGFNMKFFFELLS